MRKTASSKFSSVSGPFAFAMLLILLQGCISGTDKYISMDISGYVRSESDSTAVPGAYIIVSRLAADKGTMADTFTDGNGFYEYHQSYSMDNGESLGIRVTVVDVDGDTGGVFVSEDSVFCWENTEGISDISIVLDLYVHMASDITDVSAIHGLL